MNRSELFRTAASQAFLYICRATLRAGALCALAALFGGPFLVGGCRDVEKIEIPNIFHQTPERPLADVPVPDGFRYKDTGSYIFDRSYRVARLRYSGTPHVNEAIGFFKEQMPLSRWSFVREQGTDSRTLVFQNDIEELKISIDRDAGITSVDIDIAPRKT